MFRTHAMSVLLCILTLAFADPGLAQAPGNADSVRAAANARSFVADRGAGNKVKVKLLDGTKAEGTIVRIGKSSFELVSSNGKQLPMIEYDTVAEIKKAGWSNVAKIGLGIGIGVAAVVVIIAVAVATVEIDPFPDGFRKDR